ncbi:MAG: phosphoglycolate phosphatase [ANME-2 cluster archaeon]|nr:phosphoglycolate phosphatase [ANME-2 cluster archaeon]
MKALIIDIDGTLTDESRRLDLAAADAIRKLDIPVILASGNVLCFVKCATKLIGTSDIMIAENGGVISSGFDGPVRIKGDHTRCAGVLEMLRGHFELEELDAADRLSDVALRRNFDIEAARHIIADNGITNVELVDTGFAVHIKSMDVNKGTALLEVAALIGLDAGDIVAIGDSANDIEMLQAAGLGVAVGNANPALKDIADMVTSGRYGTGVVEALKYADKSSLWED